VLKYQPLQSVSVYLFGAIERTLGTQRSIKSAWENNERIKVDLPVPLGPKRKNFVPEVEKNEVLIPF